MQFGALFLKVKKQHTYIQVHIKYHVHHDRIVENEDSFNKLGKPTATATTSKPIYHYIFFCLNKQASWRSVLSHETFICDF